MTATKIIKEYEEIQDLMQLTVQPEKEFLNNRTDIRPELLSNGCGAHLKMLSLLLTCGIVIIKCIPVPEQTLMSLFQ